MLRKNMEHRINQVHPCQSENYPKAPKAEMGKLPLAILRLGSAKIPTGA